MFPYFDGFPNAFRNLMNLIRDQWKSLRLILAVVLRCFRNGFVFVHE